MPRPKGSKNKNSEQKEQQKLEKEEQKNANRAFDELLKRARRRGALIEVINKQIIFKSGH